MTEGTPARPKKPPYFFTIPSTATAVRCKRCPQLVYWVQTTTGKRMPVRCDVEGGVAPHPGTDTHGRGLSHFADCPAADEFRRPR